VVLKDGWQFARMPGVKMDDDHKGRPEIIVQNVEEFLKRGDASGRRAYSDDWRPRRGGRECVRIVGHFSFPLAR
jgi:hypothetical protein